MIHVTGVQGLAVIAKDDFGGVLPPNEVDKPRNVTAICYDDQTDNTKFLIANHNREFMWINEDKLFSANV